MSYTVSHIQSMSSVKGRTYFQRYYSSSPKQWFVKAKHLQRELIVTVNRIRANHYNLAESLHRIHIVSDPLCKCGLQSENINHI